MIKRKTNSDVIYEDGNKSGSTYASDFELSSTTAEWDDLGNNFKDGGTLVELLSTKAEKCDEGNIFVNIPEIPVGTHAVDIIDMTSSNGAIWYYCVKKGSAIQTGQIVTVASGSTVNSDTYSVDEGTVSGISFSFSISGGNLYFNAVTTTTGWEMQLIRNVIRDDGLAEQQIMISANKTITVDGTNGDNTFGDGTSGNPYKTIARAMEDLEFRHIKEGVTVTIDIKDGIYAYTSQLIITHPDAERIVFQGQTASTSMSAIESLTGVKGNRSMTITVTSTSGMSVGDVLILSSASGGTNPRYVEGAFRITTVDDSDSVTISYPSWGTDTPSGSVSATVTHLKTIMDFDGGGQLRVKAGTHSGTWKDLAFVGIDAGESYSGQALWMEGNSTIEYGQNVAMVGFNAGMYVLYGSVCIAPSIQITNGQYGTYALDGTIIMDNSAARIVGGWYGLVNYLNAHITFSGTIYGAQYYNVYAAAYSFLDFEGGKSYNSDSTGVFLDASMCNAKNSTCSNNDAYGFRAGERSYIWTNGATTTDNPSGSHSPGQNSRGNNYAYNDA